MISYELSLGLSIIPVLMVFGELNLGKISAFQDANGWLLLPLWGDSLPWNVAEGQPWAWGRWALWIPLMISFSHLCGVDVRRDEPSALRHGGVRNGTRRRLSHRVFLNEVCAVLPGRVCGDDHWFRLGGDTFLGGWSIPFAPLIHQYVGLQLEYIPGSTPLWLGLLHIVTFATKVLAFILFFVIIRWSLPRFRYDQLMKLGWLVMFEVALFNVILTAVLMWWCPLP